MSPCLIAAFERHPQQNRTMNVPMTDARTIEKNELQKKRKTCDRPFKIGNINFKRKIKTSCLFFDCNSCLLSSTSIYSKYDYGFDHLRDKNYSNTYFRLCQFELNRHVFNTLRQYYKIRKENPIACKRVYVSSPKYYLQHISTSLPLSDHTLAILTFILLLCRHCEIHLK